MLVKDVKMKMLNLMLVSMNSKMKALLNQDKFNNKEESFNNKLLSFKKE